MFLNCFLNEKTKVRFSVGTGLTLPTTFSKKIAVWNETQKSEEAAGSWNKAWRGFGAENSDESWNQDLSFLANN